jgi:hypothetical protein
MGIALGSGTAFAGLCVLATGSVLGAETCSTLGFATAGVMAGLSAPGGSAWAHSPSKPDDWDADDSEPPGDRVASLPESTARPVDVLAIRLFPVVAISLGSFVAAALIAPSHTALALVAVGLLGLSLLPVLRNQERRLAALERRFHSPRHE